LPGSWPDAFRWRRTFAATNRWRSITTLRIGGPADVYVEPASEADLVAAVKFCHERSLPFFVIGRGSNLLVRDGGFPRRGDLPGAAEFQPH